MPDLTTRVARTVGKHFVTLSCIQTPPSALPKELVFSGFVVELLGEWFYVTAGHIIRRVQVALARGSTFDIWRLDDQTAGNRFAGKAVPYDFRSDAWFVLQDDTIGIDYATTHLSEYYRRQLEAGGVVPIRKELWSSHVVEADHWVLMGIPSESVSYDGESILSARMVITPLTEAAVPELAERKTANQFYATPLAGSEAFFTNADGFSGGPVFALKQVDGRWLYGAIGVQSAWYPTSKTFAVCPFTSFVLALEPHVAEALAEFERLSKGPDNTNSAA